MEYEPEAPASAFRRESSIHSLALRACMRNPSVRRSRFKKCLDLYRAVVDVIEILRVPHGARDLHGLLAEGFEPSEDDEDGAPTEEPDAP
jgi:plasmid stabilization system protein ParE